jgi:UDP-N-acetylglucosamine 2-epimerase
MKKKILTILGTRPELIKMFPMVKELDKTFNNKLIWSGQHYDFTMVKKIFKDVKLRKPDLHIKIKKNRNSFFQIQEQVYKVISKHKPDAIVYHGDTFTTLATSLVSNFFFPNIKRIHVEGGYRSGDKNQIEERARTTSDQLSDIIFVTRILEKKNLIKENIKKNVHVVGNSIFNSIEQILNISNNKKINKKFIFLNKKKFIFATIHRAENVENSKRLKKILYIINNLSKDNIVFFPIHPRTKKKIKSLKLNLNSNVIINSPISYSETIYLLSKCFFSFTDSGGIQEESIILQKRCLIPSNKTPHSHYLHKYANCLVQIDKNNYMSCVYKFKKSLLTNKIKKFHHHKKATYKMTKILKKII